MLVLVLVLVIVIVLELVRVLVLVILTVGYVLNPRPPDRLRRGEKGEYLLQYRCF